MASVKKYNDGLTKTQRHRLRHPERAAQTARKYRLNHPDKSRASILKWRKENPEQWREICQRSQFKRAFGDGEGARKHYAEQRSIQQNECAICFRPLVKACSDHDHGTGRWRGVLCDCCNRAIGLLKDDIKVLASAIAYLTKWA